MRKSIQAMILGASLLGAGMLPAHATNVPIANFQGSWVGTTTYAAGAVVTYEGSTYIALQSNRNFTPIGHAARWAVLPNLPVALASFQISEITGLGAYPGTLVLETEPVPTSGWYYINATALVFVDQDDLGVYCYVSFGARGASSDGAYGGLADPFPVTSPSLTGQAAVADFWLIDAGDSAQLYCYSQDGDASSAVLNSSMTATLGTNASGTGDAPVRPEVRPQVHTVKQH